MFTMMASLCRQDPDWVVQRAGLLCPLALGRLGEGEPVVVGPLWEATLLVVAGNEVRFKSTYIVCIEF